MITNYRIENVVIPRNKVFRDISRSTARYRIWKGGAGSGKSTDIAIDKIKKLSDPRFKGCNLLCVRKVNASNRDSTFAELKKAARGFFKRHEALYECGSTERLNFFNECRKQHSTPIMESQTFNQFMEEICK